MEIRHRVAFNADVKPAFQGFLDARGIRYKVAPIPGAAIGLVYFDMVESDPNWPEVQDLIRVYGASNIFNTFFTPEEILAAEWVRLTPAYEQGYPQPEDGWADQTYADVCPQCGAGYVQKAPFHLLKEPRLGKHDFMSLFWTYTFFCVPGVVEALATHQAQGYEAWNAILHRSGQPSAVVSQLVCSAVAEPGFVAEDELPRRNCPKCGITKFESHLRGYMHLRGQALQTDMDMQLTHEWFGSGHMAFRELLISNRLAKLALEAGWRGIWLKPVILVQ